MNKRISNGVIQLIRRLKGASATSEEKELSSTKSHLEMKQRYMKS